MHTQLFEMFHHYNVLTFQDFSRKGKEPLYPFKERIHHIAHFKPQNIFIYDIARHNMKAEEFIQKVLLPINPNSIVVGTNFKFGSDQKPFTLLKKYFKVDFINYNSRVSSSVISNLLANKQVERANGYLYEPYHYISQWIKGVKRGKELGYRTINLDINHRLALCEGSYVCRIKLGNRSHRAVAFVGASKTFKNKKQTLEIHVFNRRLMPRTLYPQSVRNKVRVEFYKFIRANKQFKTQAQLAKAIAKDINSAKAYFERNK